MLYHNRIRKVIGWWREAGGGGAVFDAELWINVLEMFAHRGGTNFQDLSNLPIRFTLRDPKQDLFFARS
jgi:hypothetical protein